MSAALRSALHFAAAILAAAPAARADAPPPAPVTPGLVAAAVKEGKVAFYTAMDLPVAVMMAKAFEAKYPGISVQVERSGSERNYQRIAQEYASGIHAVDVVDSTDAAQFLDWKRNGMLAAYRPADVARWPEDQRDADGYYATQRATLSVVGYNSRLVKPEEAPKSYADLLDPKWKGKIVKANPGYSGNIVTATFVLSRTLGWSYFEKLAQQRVLQVQSATEPTKKLALGERAVMFDGNEFNMLTEIANGAPVVIVHPREGTPLLSASDAVMKDAPHPNAARLFVSFLYSREGQQLIVERANERSLDPEVKEAAGRIPLSAMKLLVADPAEEAKAIEEIKRRYAAYFGT